MPLFKPTPTAPAKPAAKRRSTEETRLLSITGKAGEDALAAMPAGSTPVDRIVTLRRVAGIATKSHASSKQSMTATPELHGRERVSAAFSKTHQKHPY